MGHAVGFYVTLCRLYSINSDCESRLTWGGTNAVQWLYLSPSDIFMMVLINISAEYLRFLNSSHTELGQNSFITFRQTAHAPTPVSTDSHKLDLPHRLIYKVLSVVKIDKQLWISQYLCYRVNTDRKPVWY